MDYIRVMGAIIGSIIYLPGAVPRHLVPAITLRTMLNIGLRFFVAEKLFSAGSSAGEMIRGSKTGNRTSKR